VGIDIDGLLRDWQSRERLFGVMALSLGMITKAQLEECLQLQQKRGGDWQMLGTIMLEKGYMTESQVRQVLEAQSGK
jgi:uncharacterized HAD superfamily protein